MLQTCNFHSVNDKSNNNCDGRPRLWTDSWFSLWTLSFMNSLVHPPRVSLSDLLPFVLCFLFILFSLPVHLCLVSAHFTFSCFPPQWSSAPVPDASHLLSRITWNWTLMRFYTCDFSTWSSRVELFTTWNLYVLVFFLFLIRCRNKSTFN